MQRPYLNFCSLNLKMIKCPAHVKQMVFIFCRLLNKIDLLMLGKNLVVKNQSLVIIQKFKFYERIFIIFLQESRFEIC